MSDRPATPPSQVPRAPTRLLTVFLALGSLFFGFAVLDRAVTIADAFSSILLVVFLAWLLSFLVAQAVDTIVRRSGIGRGKAIALVYLLVVAVVGFLVFATVQIGVRDASDMLNRTDEVTARIHGLLVGIQTSLGISRDTIDLATTFDQGQRQLFATISTSLNAEVQTIAGATVGVVSNIVIVVVLSLYAVADAEVILGSLSRVVPNRYAEELTLVERSVGRAFSGFLKTQVILVVIQAVLTIVVGILFGTPYLFLTTVVVALAMFIPFFGPPLALFPPVLVAVAFRPEVAIPVLIILAVVQTILVSVAQPRLMKESAGLHPILVLLGLLIGAQVAGLWGALFGIPFLAVVSLLVQYLVNRRAVNEVAGIDLEDAVAEIRTTDPDMPLDEAVAIAADVAEAISAGEAQPSGPEPRA